jgi:hypothetical protein
LPAIAAVMLLLLRMLRINFIFAWIFLYYLNCICGPPEVIPLALAIRLAVDYWPAYLLLAVFLVWEAPAQWAMLSRLVAVKRQGFVMIPVRGFSGLMRPKLRILFANVLMGGLWLLLIVENARYFLYLYIHVNDPWLFYIVMILGTIIVVLLIGFGVMFYWQNRASGFRPWPSALLTLARLTFVLNPFACLLGIGHGVIARCDFCNDYKFLWQVRCPHCGQVGEGTSRTDAQTKIRRWWWHGQYDQPAIFYRLAIPAVLLLIVLSFKLKP